MEDLSTNIAVVAQVEFILSRAISYPGELGYKVDLITKHTILPDMPDQQATVSVYKTEQRGYKGNFYHDYDSIKDQHDFSGSARASFMCKTPQGILYQEHSALFSIRNIAVKYEQGSFVLVPQPGTLVSLAIS